MRVTNIHKRNIQQSKANVSKLFKTLATSEDKIWPCHHWPAIRFKEGLAVGSKGGHGPVRYTVVDFEEGNYVTFKFTKPDGFHGTHEFRIYEITKDSSQIVHRINMKTTFKAGLMWIFCIRWLHDALIEDAFDNVENYFSNHLSETEREKKAPKYNYWVRFLRGYYKRKSFQTTHA